MLKQTVEFVLKPIRFAMLMLQHGRFGAKGRDFNEERNATLQIFKDFIPTPKAGVLASLATRSRSLLEKTDVTRNLIAQAAFLKSRFASFGGHLHHRGLKVSYIRIPKVASTSLSMMMLEAMYPPLKNFSLSDQEINHLADANLRKHISAEDATDLYFTVVRNPYARIVSVYKQFFNNPDGAIYDDYLLGVLPSDLSFNEFVKRVEAIPDMLKDQHFKPQHRFLEYYRRRTENILILKLEKHDELNDFFSFYDLRMPTLNTFHTGGDYRTFYDHESLRRVTKMYSEDLKMFDYEQEASSLHAFVNGSEDEKTA